MNFSENLVRALVEKFGDRDLRLGTPPEPTALFRAKHAEIGDATIRDARFAGSSIGEIALATVEIGKIVTDRFESIDSHLPREHRAEKVTQDVVRFLEHLFADRLLFWQPVGHDWSGKWRECRDGEQAEPLVIDDRTYNVYLWSGPKPQWRATTAILGRRAIRDEREYQILRIRLEDPSESGLHGAERELAKRLLADFERDPR